MARDDKPEAFLFDVDAFESDNVVEAMTTEQVGAYIRLLCKAWREEPPGTIPDDDEILARWARLPPKKWIAHRDRVLAAFKFNESDGRWHQKRMKQTFARLLEYHRRRVAAGSLGGKSRWKMDSNAIAELEPSNGKAIAGPIANGKVGCSNKNQNQKSNGIISGQANSPLAQFDQKHFEPDDWKRQCDELLRQLGPVDGDKRFIAQLAWLSCAGAPILPQIRDALDGMKSLRDSGKPPRAPLAYLRSCLNESLGRASVDALLKQSPNRGACAAIVEGA